MKNKFHLKARVHGNPDRGENPRNLIRNDIFADSINELRVKVREWQDLEGFGGGNWGNCKLYSGETLVGFMSYNGRIWEDKVDSLGGNEVLDSTLELGVTR